MGVVAALVGGALLGLGASKMMGGGQSMPEYAASSPNNLYNTAASSVPTMPEKPTNSAGTSDAMRTAGEEERKKLAAQAEANRTSLTGGLGVTNPATVQRKTLLGT